MTELEFEFIFEEDDEDINYKIIDMFAGTGGFSQAFKKFDGFKSIFANDMVKESEDIYKLNYPETKFKVDDIHNINVTDIPSHNILCNGFPCQPFSIAGEQKGFKDTRSNVFWKILEILEFHKPEIVIFENVKNLKTHDGGKTFKIIEESISEIGYHYKYAILDTCKITNIPHHRERIYIVCFKDSELCNKFNFDFPKLKNKLIKSFLENNIDDKYYYTDKFKVYDEIEKTVTKHINDNVIYQYRRYYVRENKNDVCPTLTANMGSGGHNVPLILDDRGIRKLTPRECFNLQGFPKDYKLPNISDSKLYKLAGNAISVPVVELIARSIIKIIKNE